MKTVPLSTKKRCLPPHGVWLVSVVGNGLFFAMSCSSSFGPSIPLLGSISVSSTQRPLGLPVAIPIIADGYCVHHSVICFSSVVASLQPLGVIGALLSVRQGKIGRPCFPQASAAASMLAIRCFLPIGYTDPRGSPVVLVTAHSDARCAPSC